MTAASAALDENVHPSIGDALLPLESKADFDALLHRLTTQFAPHDPATQALVLNLHECCWRIARTRRTETFLYLLGIREQLANFADEPSESTRHSLAQAAAYRANARQFDQLRRHENRLLLEQRALELYLKALSTDPSPRGATTLPAHSAQLKAALDILSKPSQPPPPAPPGDVPASPVPEMPHFTGPMRDIKRKQWLRQNAR